MLDIITGKAHLHGISVNALTHALIHHSGIGKTHVFIRAGGSADRAVICIHTNRNTGMIELHNGIIRELPDSLRLEIAGRTHLHANPSVCTQLNEIIVTGHGNSMSHALCSELNCNFDILAVSTFARVNRVRHSVLFCLRKKIGIQRIWKRLFIPGHIASHDPISIELSCILQHAKIRFHIQMTHTAHNNACVDIRLLLRAGQAFLYTLDHIPDRQALCGGEGRGKTHLQILDLLLCRSKRQIFRSYAKSLFGLDAGNRRVKAFQIFRKTLTVHRSLQHGKKFLLLKVFSLFCQKFPNDIHAHGSVQMTMQFNLWHIVSNKSVHSVSSLNLFSFEL